MSKTTINLSQKFIYQIAGGFILSIIFLFIFHLFSTWEATYKDESTPNPNYNNQMPYDAISNNLNINSRIWDGYSIDCKLRKGIVHSFRKDGTFDYKITETKLNSYKYEHSVSAIFDQHIFEILWLTALFTFIIYYGSSIKIKLTD